MTVSNPTYDLVILLDPEAEEPARAKIVADARTAIDANGEVLRHDRWGQRALSYPIRRKTSAEYHLLQFRAAGPELLSRLNRSLRITDGILRFRIIKLKPGVPEPPDMASSGTAAAAADSDASASASRGGPPASSGAPQAPASDAATSGADAASGGAPTSGANAPAPGAEAPTSGGDAAGTGATPTEPGAAGGAAESPERVRAGST